MTQKLSDSLLHCEFCRFATFSAPQFQTHLGKCHEQLLADEGDAKRARESWEAEKRARDAKGKPSYQPSLGVLYGKNYFICSTCLRPSIATPTPAHPEPGVCHNYYWHDWAKEARARWVKGIRLDPWLEEYLASETAGVPSVAMSQSALL